MFLVILSNFFIIPVVKKKIKVKLAVAIPTGAPATLPDEMIHTPQLVALKTIKINQRQKHIYLIFYCMVSFD